MQDVKNIAETISALGRIQQAIISGHGASLARLDASWIGHAAEILIGVVLEATAKTAPDGNCEPLDPGAAR